MFNSYKLLVAALALAAVLTATNAGSGRAATLLMFEQDYCEWCERWHEEIGVVYHKTTEGKRAPLRKVDIHSPLPEDISHIKRLTNAT